MSTRSTPVGKSDVIVRMTDELKLALQEQAKIEHRSLPNLVCHVAQVYLDSKGLAA